MASGRGPHLHVSPRSSEILGDRRTAIHRVWETRRRAGGGSRVHQPRTRPLRTTARGSRECDPEHSIGYIPHSPDAPFALLADVAEAEASRLRKLRLLLLARSRELAPEGNADRAAKQLALEIDDALRDMADRTTAFTRKRGLDQAQEPLGGGTARFLARGQKLTHATPDSPFAPLFILQSLGYGWRVDGPDAGVIGGDLLEQF